MKTENLLKNLLFRGVEKNEIEILLKCLQAHTIKFAKEELILRRGDRIESIGLLLQGNAHIIKDDYWGNRSIIKEVRCGELFAEAYACIAGKELEVSLLAKEECEVMFLNVQHITSMCEKACRYHQRMIQNLLMIASMKNLALTQKMEHITKRTTREKILSYLSSQSLEQGGLVVQIPFNRQQLADYLGVDRSNLSNELGKMQKENIIKFHKNEFELL